MGYTKLYTFVIQFFRCLCESWVLARVFIFCPGCQAWIRATASVGVGASASPGASDSKEPGAGGHGAAQSQEEDPGVWAGCPGKHSHLQIWHKVRISSCRSWSLIFDLATVILTVWTELMWGTLWWKLDLTNSLWGGLQFWLIHPKRVDEH